jgi:hypothetical protein
MLVVTYGNIVPLMRPYGLVIQRAFRSLRLRREATFYIGEGSAFRDHSFVLLGWESILSSLVLYSMNAVALSGDTR